MCADWPRELFDDLIAHVARVTLKYHGITPLGAYDRRATDRLIAELREVLERNQSARERTRAGSGEPPESNDHD